MAVRYWQLLRLQVLSEVCRLTSSFSTSSRSSQITCRSSFFASVYPTITSGKSTKVIIISTPQGMNHFYKMWQDAVNGRNGYTFHEVHWSQVPGRDAEWKEQTSKTLPRDSSHRNLSVNSWDRLTH